MKERFLRPTKEALELEKKFDRLGDDVRRFGYSQVMMDPSADKNLLRGWGLLNGDRIPQWQKLLLKATIPLLKPFIDKVLNLTPEAGRASMRKAREGTLKEVEEMLSDGRKYLLGTEEPTYVDVAFAALASVLVMPDM